MTSLDRDLIFIDECAEALGTFPDGSFSCGVTSPPYNVGIDYGTGPGEGTAFNDRKPFAEYLAGLTADFTALFPKMADPSLLWVNISDSAQDPMKSFHVAQAVISAGFHLIQKIVWVKSITIPVLGKKVRVATPDGEKSLPIAQEWFSTGHYTPVGADTRFHNAHESIWLFSKTPGTRLDRKAIGVPYQDRSNARRYGGGKDLRPPGDVWAVDLPVSDPYWFIPYETTGAVRKKGHPAPFPIELAARCLAVSPPGWTVDPYSGYGSTARASIDAGRKFVMIERNVELALEGVRYHKLQTSDLAIHYRFEVSGRSFEGCIPCASCPNSVCSPGSDPLY